jgi:hypothetical protein
VAAPRTGRKDDRLFVREGRRSYRRRFSRTEVRLGASVLVVLGAIGAWVAWKGQHPDPSLFAPGFEADPLAKSPARTVVDGAVPGAADRTPGGAASGEVGGAATAAGAGERGPLPTGLAGSGFSEGKITHFDPTNLYIKVDGREDFYKGFGFKALHCVSLTARDNAAVTVDIELYDLGTAANALGAYAGERAPDAVSQVNGSGLWHRSRNAEFATAGRFYGRILGADESAPVIAQLEQARRALTAALPAEPLPWGYELFVAGMKFDPGHVSYTPENAYSLGFARNVYAAPLGDGDIEGFVVAAADAKSAAALAERFIHGFLDYGDDAGTGPNLHWVRDRNLHTLMTARAAGVWVVGVRGAADAKRGAAALTRLEGAVRALPPATVARAQADANATPAEPATPSGEPGGAGSAEPHG